MRKVRVIIEIEPVDECASTYANSGLTDECRDEIVSRLADYASMIYVSRV
jgi:hypothetical protein